MEGCKKLRATPDFVRVKRIERSIPQYLVGHQRIVNAIREMEREHAGIFVASNFCEGISVADCIAQALAVAERITEGK